MRTSARFRAETKYEASTGKKANTNLPIMATVGDHLAGVAAVAGRPGWYHIRLGGESVANPNATVASRLTQCKAEGVGLVLNDLIFVIKARDRDLTYYKFHSFIQNTAGTSPYPAGITIPDNVNPAYFIMDDGAAAPATIEYLRIITTNAGPGQEVVFNNGQVDVNFTINASALANAFHLDGLAGGITVAGPSMTVPAAWNLLGVDNNANLMGIDDAGGLEYLRVVSTNANPYVLLFPAGGGRGGLGTTTPSCAWDVVADAATAGIESTAATGQYLLRLIDRGAPANFWGMYFSAGFDLIFRETGGNDRIYFMAGGDVGINTATVPHGGIGHAMVALDGANASDTGPHIQITTASDNYPIFGITAWSHDDVRLYFDCYRDAVDAREESSDIGSNFQIRKVSDQLYFRTNSGDAQAAAIVWDFDIIMDTNGNWFPGAAKQQDLGLAANEWDDLYWVTSNQGTSRLVRTKRICPVCQTEMSRGTGGLVILGEAADYVLCFCLNCGNAGIEELNHLPPESESQKQPPPKIVLRNIRVKSAGRNRSVAVDFCYGDDVLNDDGEIIERAVSNSTRLGEYEIEEFLEMNDTERLAFLLALGRREWYAREESRLMREEAKTFRNTINAKVNAWIGKDLLEVN